MVRTYLDFERPLAEIDAKIDDLIAKEGEDAGGLSELQGKAEEELKRLYAHAKGSLGFGRFDPIDQIAAQMEAFLDQRRARFDVRLAPLGSAFTQEVWRALRDIPAGETRSYSDVARSMGRPNATRAVARANGAIPIAVVIPCHRVLGADGALTGYGGGLWRKQALIDLERGFAAQKQEKT